MGIDNGPSESAAGAPEKTEGHSLLDASLKIEVDVLSLLSIGKLVDAVAQRVANFVTAERPTAKIVVASSRTLALLGPAVVLRTELRSLNTNMASHLAAGQDEGYESTLPLADVLTGAIGGLAELLSWLRVDTTWTGRDSELSTALPTMLAGKVRIRGQGCILFDDLFPPADGITEFVTEVQHLRELRAEIAAEVESGHHNASWLSVARARLAAADSWLGIVSPAAPGLPSSMASAIASSFGFDVDNALILTAEVLKSGGHYRVRRHLFSTLFGNGGLTYSGGAIVSYQLQDVKSGELFLGGTAHAITGDVQFGPPPPHGVPLASLP